MVRELTSTEVIDAELERVRLPDDRVEDRPRTLFVLSVGGLRLAIDAALVEAVLDDMGCSPVPGAPPHIPGVITHHDQMLALLDLAAFCRLPKHEANGLSRTVIIAHGLLRAALRCTTSGLIELPESALTAPKILVAEGGLAPYLAAECETPWGFCGVLDVALLLEAARVRA